MSRKHYKSPNTENYKKLNREYKKRYNDKTRKTAFNERKPWTISEIQMIIKKEYSDRELSLKLGRSINAIQVKRHSVNN